MPKNELEAYLHEENIKVACLQETNLKSTTSVSFRNYAFTRRDRPTADGGGGVGILVHHDIEFSPIDVSALESNDNKLEIVAVKIHLRSQ